MRERDRDGEEERRLRIPIEMAAAEEAGRTGTERRRRRAARRVIPERMGRDSGWEEGGRRGGGDAAENRVAPPEHPTAAAENTIFVCFAVIEFDGLQTMQGFNSYITYYKKYYSCLDNWHNITFLGINGCLVPNLHYKIPS